MMKKTKYVPVLILLYVITSCSESATPDIARETPQIVEPFNVVTVETPTLIHTEEPTKASNSESTPTPTHAIVLELDELTPGIYLTYAEPGESEIDLIFIRSDGSSRVVHSFPQHRFYSWKPIDGISPDGIYFAYLSGSAGEWGSIAQGWDYDLQIIIASITDGTIIEEIPLISDTYPADIQDLAGSLNNITVPEYEWMTDDEVELSQHQAFLSGMGAMEWSPDAKILAFAAQIDGPSSDLYIFDSVDGTITRLTSGLEHLQRISWSPDSHRIMHASSYLVGVNPPYTNHVASVDGLSVFSFPHDLGELEDGWMNEYSYFTHEAANGVGEYDIKHLNTRDGTVISVWPHQFATYSFNPLGDQLVVSVIDNFIGEVEPGIYFVNPYSSKRERLDSGYWGIVKPLMNDLYPFVASKGHDGVYLIQGDAEFVKISDTGWSIEPSPNGKSIALFNSQRNPGLELFVIENSSTVSVSSDRVIDVLWSPDSRGFFFLSNGSLYYYGVIDKEIIEIDKKIEGHFPYWGQFKFIEVD